MAPLRERQALLWICMALLRVDTGRRLVSSGGDAV